MQSAVKRKLAKVGTVCTGLATGEFAAKALEKLNKGALEVEVLFGCDIDPDAKALFLASHPEAIWYEDVFDKSFSKAPPVDLFMAGFPCQSFSSEGLQLGVDDARGTVIYAILKYIRANKPSAVMLENVAGLAHLFPEVLLMICTELKEAGYLVGWRKLNTKVHGGLPQTRTRVYIVAVSKNCARGPLNTVWPDEVPMASLKSLLSQPIKYGPGLPSGAGARKKVRKGIRFLKRAGVNHKSAPVACDCDGRGPGRLTVNYIPCLTATRATGGGFWIMCKGGKLSVAEMMRFQGMRLNQFPKKAVLAVNATKLSKMIGNAFTQSVVQAILAKLLPLAGLSRRNHLRSGIGSSKTC